MLDSVSPTPSAAAMAAQDKSLLIVDDDAPS